MAITSKDIEEVIATEDDFGHEMRVGRLLRGYFGSQTLQGGTYIDPVSGKARQFDFRLATPISGAWIKSGHRM